MQGAQSASWPNSKSHPGHCLEEQRQMAQVLSAKLVLRQHQQYKKSMAKNMTATYEGHF